MISIVRNNVYRVASILYERVCNELQREVKSTTFKSFPSLPLSITLKNYIQVTGSPLESHLLCFQINLA